MIKQNASNQKSREHKKMIDPAPCKAQSDVEIGDYTIRFSDDLTGKVMPNDNEKNRNSPHSIKLSYAFHVREKLGDWKSTPSVRLHLFCFINNIFICYQFFSILCSLFMLQLSERHENQNC